MSYSLSICITLDTAGLTLNAALFSAGTIHATARDLAVVEIGQKLYAFQTSAMPDSYRGTLVVYTGTLGSATDFTGVTVKGGTSINPQEVENPDVKTSTLNAIAPDNASIATILTRTDVATSTRNATTPPTAAAVATAVWDYLTSSATTAGSVGKRLLDFVTSLVYAAAPTAVAVRTEMDSNSTKLANLDVAVSTRSTYAGADTSGTTTLLARLTNTRASLLDNLDAAISTRLAASGYTAPDNSNIGVIVGRLTSARALLLDNLSNLDALISSRNATAPDNASIATILSRTDVATSTRSSHSVADVWAAATRTLTAFADSSGVTTLLGRLTSTRAALLDNLDGAISGIAGAVWSAGTRSLTTFGTLADDVWAATVRTLTSGGGGGGGGSDSSGVTTLLSRIASALTITDGKVDVNDKTGFALTSPYDAAKTALQDGGHVVATNMRGTDGALLAADYNANDGLSVDAIAALEGADQILLADLYIPTGKPAIVVPAAPADVLLCRVYGYFENLDNSDTNAVQITFDLPGNSPVKTNRIVDPTKIVATIRKGVLTDKNGNPWQDLQRNDKLVPDGSQYAISCDALRLNKTVSLVTPTLDLASLVP